MSTGRNTKGKEAPLAVINGAVKIELEFGEMNALMNHCNILKGFVQTPLANGRSLHKNAKVIGEKIQELSEIGQMIEERRGKLHQMMADPTATLEQKEDTSRLMLELIDETRTFNKAKHGLFLHTVSIKDYPEKPEAFGKKSIPQQNAPAVEIEYYSSFLELSDVIIVD